jgi:hypothetical protein
MLYNLLKVCVLPPSSMFFDHENRSDMFLWNDYLPIDYVMLHHKLLITTTVRTRNPIWRHSSLFVWSCSLASLLYCGILKEAVFPWQCTSSFGCFGTRIGSLLPPPSCTSCHHVLNTACSYVNAPFRWCML